MFKTFANENGFITENVGTTENPVFKKRLVNKPLFIMFILHIILYVVTVIYGCMHSYFYLVFSAYFVFFCYPLDVIIYKFFIKFTPVKAKVLNYEPVSNVNLYSVTHGLPLYGTAEYEFEYKGETYRTKAATPGVDLTDIGKEVTIRVARSCPSIVLTSFDSLVTATMCLGSILLFMTSFDRVEYLDKFN